MSALTFSHLATLEAFALDHGFDFFSAAPAVIPQKDQQAYRQWVASGGAADMAYLTRDPQKRLNPSLAFPHAQTVLTLGVSYFGGAFPESPGSAYGRVARYAWGRDYHEVLLERLAVFQAAAADIVGDVSSTTPAVDTKPLLERVLAAQGGKGFIGKNTLFISPRTASQTYHLGSYLFLAEVVVTKPLENDLAPKPLSGCGSCRRCLTSCPTQAFEGPYVLRAEKCISYLTIENKKWIPRELRSRLSDWVFGCDVCQDVCPFNARHLEARWPEFSSAHGVGAWLSLEEVLSTKTDADIHHRWKQTPLTRPKRRGLVRNASVVAANNHAEELAPRLRELMDDPDPVIRGHALWAWAQLTPVAHARPVLDRYRRKETDVDAYHEATALLEAYA